MSLNDIGDRIASSLGERFAPGDDSRQTKFRRGEKGGDGKSSEKRMGAETRNPFAPEQCEWLQGALKHSLASFGAAVAEEMHKVRNIAEETKSTVDKVETKVGELKAQNDRDIGDLRSDIAELKRRMELGEAASARGGGPEAIAQPGTPQQPRAHVQQPTQDLSFGRLGNLGWDTEGNELARRTSKILQAANIPADNILWTSPLVGRGSRGSASQVQFRSPGALQLAKAKIRELKKSYEEGRNVWLDIQKSRDQLRPSRMTHRACEVFEDFERSRPDAMTVEKLLASKTTKVGGNRVAFVLDNTIRFTIWAMTRYSNEQLDIVRGYCDS